MKGDQIALRQGHKPNHTTTKKKKGKKKLKLMPTHDAYVQVTLPIIRIKMYRMMYINHICTKIKLTEQKLNNIGSKCRHVMHMYKFDLQC